MRFCTECHRTVLDESQTLCPDEVCRGSLRHEPLLGELLDGRFRVESVHSSGGIGVLLRAQHTRLGTPVAVKVLDLRDADPEVAADMAVRFRREATIIARLRHPSIVEISDFGVAPDGRSYIVMEFLEGRDLEDEIRHRSPLSPGRVEWILEHVCDALSWIHDHGVIHRDIKPANIVLTRLGGEECVKLLDFGIAKLLDEGPSPVSRTNVVIGTPEYMAPEQIQPTLGPIGRATDIYALAVTTYEMLAGQTPFHYDTFLRICQHKLAVHYPPLSRLRANQGLEALDPVLKRALAREPLCRQQSIAEFMEDVAQALKPARQTGAPRPLGVVERPVVVLGDEPVRDRRALRETLPESEWLEPVEQREGCCSVCRAPLEPEMLVCSLCGAMVPLADPYVGRVVAGQYRIEERVRIDEEGLSYRATDLRGERRVELALVPVGPGDEEAQRRVLGERARSFSRVRHPGLVSTVDGGYDRLLGVGFYVVEWVDGQDLQRASRSRGLVDLGAVRGLLLSVLEPLGFLHREGLVYHGLQPSNVLLLSGDGGERVALRDLFRARRSSEMSLMVTLGRLGAPQYSAPEQLWAEHGATTRSDIYSAGALLYFCLTGQAPYDAPTAGLVLERMRTGRLVPPSTLEPLRATPSWEAIVLRAMSHSPEERFATAERMAEAVRLA